MCARIKYRRDFVEQYLMVFFFVASVVLEGSVWASRPEGIVNSAALILKTMRYFSYFLAVLIIIKKPFYYKKLLSAIIFAITIITISMLASTSKTMLLYMLIFVAALNMESERLIKCTFIAQASLLLLIVGCSMLGIVQDYIWIESGSRLRHFLGFSWTTIGPVLYFYLLLQYIFLRKGKINIIEYAIFMMIDIFFFKMTNTRTCFYVSILFLTFFLVYSFTKSKGRLVKKIKYLCIITPFISAGISLWSAMSYDANNYLWRYWDIFFNGRLSLGRKGMVDYGITLFGQPVKWVGNGLQVLLNGYSAEYNYVDSAYLQILYQYGCLLLILILIVFSALVYISIKREKFYLTWILLIISVYCITEPRLVNLTYNPFILLCATEWTEYYKHCDIEQRIMGSIERDIQCDGKLYE